MFIVFEGIDGSGKSTHSRLLYNILLKRGVEASITREPSKGEVGSFIKSLIDSQRKTSPITETLLFTADRFEHLNSEVNPLLEKGRIVICDRYFYSTLAYQGAQGVDIQWVRVLNHFARKPDIVFYLDINPEIALKRIKKKRSIFENKSLLQAARSIYMNLVEKDEMIRLDSSLQINQVSMQIMDHLKGLM